jgi:putative N6-adenine-specific DNA methylase
LDSYFVVTAPGLEALTVQELAQLGLIPADQQPEPGGVTIKGDLTALYRTNLHLRTASRIIARLGQFFYASTFAELEQKSARLPWERFLVPGQPVAIRVTCHKSKLYHSEAVAERIEGTIADRLGKPSPRRKAGDEEDADPAQLVIVRVANDQVTVSVDSSGELLHRRGYRQAVAKAPLRETLAAGILLASGWDAKSPLIDPFCGSGTIPIEAALLARKIAPGKNRRFAFMDWPNFDEKLWKMVLAEAAGNESVEIPPILASDRDAGAVKMAQENAQRAGVADSIQFDCQAVSAIQPTRQKGWVVTNPPYGLRVSEGHDLRNLYAQFGNVLRASCPGWRVAVLSSELSLLGQMGFQLDTSFSLTNGGVFVRLGRGQVD